MLNSFLNARLEEDVNILTYTLKDMLHFAGEISSRMDSSFSGWPAPLSS